MNMAADAISADCHTTYRATHSRETRPNSSVKWIVMHSTEGGTAAGVARMFAGANAEGSSHLVVDDVACFRCLKNNEIPWAAPSANTAGFHIEQCGYAAWTAEQWEKHMPMLRRAAYKAAVHCKVFRIPVRFCTAADLKAGRKGITTHAEVSKAFPNKLGNHHDPGTGWPRALFLSLVKHYFTELNV